MKVPRNARVFGMVVTLMFFSATSMSGKSSKLITSWKNPTVKVGHFKRVLVIGMSANPGRRSDFEDALSAALTTSGVEIIPGNTILLRPDASPLNLTYLREQIRANKVDAVVVSRLVSIKDAVTYIPPDVGFPYPYYNSFYGYYGRVSPIVYSPGYLIQEKTIRIETNVYAVTSAEGELVWTGTSDTFNPKNAQKVISSVVKLVSQALNKAGIF
jgi:hypothetical protein